MLLKLLVRLAKLIQTLNEITPNEQIIYLQYDKLIFY